MMAPGKTEIDSTRVIMKKLLRLQNLTFAVIEFVRTIKTNIYPQKQEMVGKTNERDGTWGLDNKRMEGDNEKEGRQAEGSKTENENKTRRKNKER